MCVLLSLFWPTFQSLIYELVDEDGCSSSFDISTRITQCAGFSSIRMYDDHDEVSHWVKSEQSEDCKHVFFWIFWLEGLGIYWRYRNRYRAFWVPEKSIGIGIGIVWNLGYRHTLPRVFRVSSGVRCPRVFHKVWSLLVVCSDVCICATVLSSVSQCANCCGSVQVCQSGLKCFTKCDGDGTETAFILPGIRVRIQSFNLKRSILK